MRTRSRQILSGICLVAVSVTFIVGLCRQNSTSSTLRTPTAAQTTLYPSLRPSGFFYSCIDLDKQIKAGKRLAASDVVRQLGEPDLVKSGASPYAVAWAYRYVREDDGTVDVAMVLFPRSPDGVNSIQFNAVNAIDWRSWAKYQPPPNQHGSKP